MKIVFEHEGRRTTVIGIDYNSIVEKIRSIFPDQNHRSIQFYDAELTDYFEFNSFEQIADQPNGIKMNFDMSNTSNLFIADNSSSLCLNNYEIDEKNNRVTPKTYRRRIRKTNQTELNVSFLVSFFYPSFKLFLG